MKLLRWKRSSTRMKKKHKDCKQHKVIKKAVTSNKKKLTYKTTKHGC